MMLDTIFPPVTDAPLTADDVNTLLGYAFLLRCRREHDMPRYFDDLARRIERTLSKPE